MPDTAEGIAGPVRAPALNAPPGTDQWALVFEVAPGSGDVPMAVRLRQIIKYAFRRHGVRCAGVLSNVPHPFFEPVEFTEGQL
jgi:hypothetical protein